METTNITRQYIKDNRFEVHEFITYFLWLAEQDKDFELTAGQVAKMFELGVCGGVHWSDAADEAGLPECNDWHI